MPLKNGFGHVLPSWFPMSCPRKDIVSLEKLQVKGTGEEMERRGEYASAILPSALWGQHFSEGYYDTHLSPLIVTLC